MLKEQVIDILEKEMEKMTLEDDDPSNPKVRITLYENEFKKIITKEKNLLTKYLDNKVSESLFDSMSSELSKTKEGIEEQIQTLKEYKPNTINIDNKTLLKKYLKKKIWKSLGINTLSNRNFGMSYTENLGTLPLMAIWPNI